MANTRHKDVDWNLGATITWTSLPIAVLMDIRDELKRSNALTAQLLSLANCHRIPKALDALAEMGAEARRKKRLAAARRKAALARK